MRWIDFLWLMLVILCSIAIFARSAKAEEPSWNPATIRVTEVTVIWSHPQAIRIQCQEDAAVACSYVKNSRCTIYSAEPENWYDFQRFLSLGHELWHCLGAKHKGFNP